LQNGPDLRGSCGLGPLSVGEVSVPNRSPNAIVAKIYGGRAEVLEPNWLFVLAEPHSREARGALPP